MIGLLIIQHQYLRAAENCSAGDKVDRKPIELSKIALKSAGDVYYWKNSSQLLIVHASGYTTHLELYDLITHKRESLHRLNHLLENSFALHGQLEMSPDGAWILWTAEQGGIRLAKINGKNDYTYRGSWRHNLIFWLSDSLWIMFNNIDIGQKPESVFVREPGKSKVLRQLSISPSASLNRDLGNLWSFTSENRLTVIGLPFEEHAITVKQFTFSSIIKQINETKVVVKPANSNDLSTIDQAVISPSGKRLAWVLLSRIKNIYASALWVSDIDGGNRCELIHETGESPERLIHCVRWMRNGRYISFLSKESIWKVQTD